MRARKRVSINTAIGRLEAVLKPILFSKPLLGISKTAGLIGCIFILMEEDNTTKEAILTGRDALQRHVASTLTQLLSHVSLPSQTITEQQINGVTA